MKPTAVADGSHWVINGRKAHHWRARRADRHRHGKSMDGACMFLVDLPNPAIHIDASRTRSIIRCRRHAIVDIRNLRVSSEHMLGNSGDGFTYAQVRLSPARLSHACVGSAPAPAPTRLRSAMPIGAWRSAKHSSTTRGWLHACRKPD